MSAPGAAAALDAQRSQNGTAYAFRYQYLAGGVNTKSGWETWNQPAGQFAAFYMQENAQHGYTPAFVYYELCQSNGPHPGNFCYGAALQLLASLPGIEQAAIRFDGFGDDTRVPKDPRTIHIVLIFRA